MLSSARLRAASSAAPAVPALTDDDAELVADECRAAGEAFLSGVAAGWAKRDFAEWLMGPYRDATRHLVRDTPTPSGEYPVESLSRCLDEIFSHVRLLLIASLDDASREGGNVDFVSESLTHRLIIPARSASGRNLWVPVDAPARLRLRVQALFAVDYLLRPADYTTDLFICPLCAQVTFDAQARQLGLCPQHPRRSSIPAAIDSSKAIA